MHALRWFLLLSLSSGLTQCASQESKSMNAAEASKPRSMNERFNGRGKQGYYQDSEGNWKVQNDKRSSFEQVGRSTLDDRSLRREAYPTEQFEKRSWWGKNNYQKPTYQPESSALARKTTAAAAGQKALEQNQLAKLPDERERQRFATESADSDDQARFRDANDKATERDAQDLHPDIMDWKEQRSLQLQDTKSWLNK
jgi:hypothetical protein